MHVICYGDSNTYGYDPRSFWGERYAHPWPELLAEKTGWNVVNIGENGRVIPNLPITLPENLDLLILMLGTNDLLQGKTVAETVCRMEKMLTGLKLEKEKILLLAPPPMTLGEWVPDRTLIDCAVELGCGYEALAKRLGIWYAGVKGIGKMCFDGVHLTEEGHEAFAEELYQLLKKGE